MSRNVTNILVVVLLLAAVAAVLAGWRMSASRQVAANAEQDFAAAHADLADLEAWHVTASSADGSADTSDLNRRIRAAALTVELVDKVVSVEPGPSVRVRGTDLMRTPVYLRVENVTLRELVTFLQGLTRVDAAARVTGIDLSSPNAPQEAKMAELWNADVTLSESAVAAGGEE